MNDSLWQRPQLAHSILPSPSAGSLPLCGSLVSPWWGHLDFLVNPHPSDRSVTFGPAPSPTTHPECACGWASQMPFFLLVSFSSLVGAVPDSDRPGASLQLLDCVSTRSQHFPAGTKFKKFAIRHYEPAGDRAATSKVDRKINLSHSGRVVSRVACEHLCSTGDWFLPSGYLSPLPPRPCRESDKG